MLMPHREKEQPAPINPSPFWAIIFPVLFGITATFLDIPSLEIWGERPLENTMTRSVLFKLLAPVELAAYFLIPLTFMLTAAMAQISTFFALQLPYLFFSLFLFIRYRESTARVRWKASLTGSGIIYSVVLFTLFNKKITGDGQTGFTVIIGLNTAFLMALTVTEIIRFPWRRIVFRRRGVRDFLSDKD